MPITWRPVVSLRGQTTPSWVGRRSARCQNGASTKASLKPASTFGLPRGAEGWVEHFSPLSSRRLETQASGDAGIWTLQAGIFPENIASLAIHNACGFREVGLRERIGKMGDVWRDTLLLERRSRVVGV